MDTPALEVTAARDLLEFSTIDGDAAFLNHIGGFVASMAYYRGGQKNLAQDRNNTERESLRVVGMSASSSP